MKSNSGHSTSKKSKIFNIAMVSFQIHKHFIPLCLIIFLTFTVYSNILPNDFISDDVASIPQNPALGNFWYNLTHTSPGNILYSFIFQIAHAQPWAYHLNSIVWHTGVTILVYFIVYLLTRQKLFGLITALLFATHPIHTEAVSWIAGLPYVLSSFFSLLTLFLIMLMDKNLLGKKWIVISTLTAFIAFNTSEKTIVLPFILGLYLMLNAGEAREKKLRLVAYLAPIVGVLFLYLVPLLGRLTERITIVNQSSGTTSYVFNPLEQVPTAISTYLQLLFWPQNLSLYHELVINHIQLYTYMAIMVILIGLIVLFYRKNKLLFLASGIFFIGLIPTLLPIKIAWVVAERYVYFSSIGFCMGVAFLLLQIKKRSSAAFWLGLILLVGFYTALTIKRNAQWKNVDVFWPATLAASPDSSMAHNNMGDYYYRHGNVKLAIGEFTKAVELNPNNADALFNLGNIYYTSGDSTKSAQLFARAFSINPAILDAAIALAIINLKQGHTDSAQEYFAKAQSIPITSARDYNSWGVFYTNVGDYKKAAEMYTKALAINPGYDLARRNLEVVKHF